MSRAMARASYWEKWEYCGRVESRGGPYTLSFWNSNTRWTRMNSKDNKKRNKTIKSFSLFSTFVDPLSTIVIIDQHFSDFQEIQLYAFHFIFLKVFNTQQLRVQIFVVKILCNKFRFCYWSVKLIGQRCWTSPAFS